MKIFFFLVALGLALPVTAQADVTDDMAVCEARLMQMKAAGEKTPRDAASQYCLGLGYSTGRIGTRDLTTASKWLALAAEQNHAGALTLLGYHYEKGLGVASDPTAALALYKRVAGQNHADGLFNVGRAYENGIGVTPDRGEARKWYEAAALGGNEVAKRTLAAMGRAPEITSPGSSLFDEGQRLYKGGNLVAAFSAFKQAAEQGDARAQLQVGYQYEFAEGVSENFGEAARWYALAANKGNPIAQRNLGNMYEEGKGVPEDWITAAVWHRKSAEQHDPKGQAALARMYEFGIGVPQSRGDALTWFHLAAAQGDSKAAYFEKHLQQPGNFIGFRNELEEATVLGSKLRFALSRQEPAGMTFRNSGERTAYLISLRREIDLQEATTMYGIRKQEYDDCVRGGGGGCVGPGPAPQ